MLRCTAEPAAAAPRLLLDSSDSLAAWCGGNRNKPGALWRFMGLAVCHWL